jgi:hypothetical protein
VPFLCLYKRDLVSAKDRVHPSDNFIEETSSHCPYYALPRSRDARQESRQLSRVFKSELFWAIEEYEETADAVCAANTIFAFIICRLFLQLCLLRGEGCLAKAAIHPDQTIALQARRALSGRKLPVARVLHSIVATIPEPCRVGTWHAARSARPALIREACEEFHPDGKRLRFLGQRAAGLRRIAHSRLY